jgi:hypothetical protein
MIILSKVIIKNLCFFFSSLKKRKLESLSNELDREIEHEKQKLNTTTTIKHVTIIEPPTRPSASVDDLSRTNKTISGQLGFFFFL